MTGEGRVHVISKQSNAEHCDVREAAARYQEMCQNMSDLSGQIWPHPAVIKIISFIFFALLCDSIQILSLSLVVVTSQQSDELVGILIERGFNEINL